MYFLKTLQERQGTAAATAEAWRANAAAWAGRLGGSYPGYRDLTQPLVLAVAEARRGLAMMAAAADIASPLGRGSPAAGGLFPTGGGGAAQLEGMLRMLMAFPAAAGAAGGAAVAELASGQAQGLVASLAANAAVRH